jgi:carbonic anhydrase
MTSQQLSPAVTPAGSGIGRASGFELTSPEQPGTANVGAALERNRAFAAAGGHEGAVVFPYLGLFVITCLDPRVDPAHFLGLGLSDAMVVRNVGGRVTPEVINDVAFIGQLAENVLPDGSLFEVAVIHHTQCGTGALADDTFRRRYAQRIGADEATLREHAVLDPAGTVTRDVERLRSAPAISPRVTFSGHVYDVVTGLVQTVIPATLGRAPNYATREELAAHSFDPTQGRKLGSEPYDDPTQGGKLGSDPYDDPTRAR